MYKEKNQRKKKNSNERDQTTSSKTKQIEKGFKKGRGDYLRLHCTQSADSNHSDAAIQRQYNVGFYLLTFGDRHFLFILPTKCHLVQFDKVYKAAEIEKPHVVPSHFPSPPCYYTRAFQMKV